MWNAFFVAHIIHNLYVFIHKCEMFFKWGSKLNMTGPTLPPRNLGENDFDAGNQHSATKAPVKRSYMRLTQPCSHQNTHIYNHVSNIASPKRDRNNAFLSAFQTPGISHTDGRTKCMVRSQYRFQLYKARPTTPNIMAIE